MFESIITSKIFLIFMTLLSPPPKNVKNDKKNGQNNIDNDVKSICKIHGTIIIWVSGAWWQLYN